jgi:hypothetical protein
MILLQDEHGQNWWVDKADPAWEYVQHLRKKKYRLIVLPRCVIIEGSRAELPTHRQRWGLEGISRESALRLKECLWELRNVLP